MRVHLQTPNAVSLALGVIFIAIGIYGYLHTADYHARAREVQAVVVELAYQTATLQKGRVHPVVRFQTASGTEITARSQKHRNVHPGDTLQIIYDPDAPQQIEIGTLAQARTRRALLTAAAIVLGLVLSARALLLEMRRPRAADDET